MSGVDYMTGVINVTDIQAIWEDCFYGNAISDYDIALENGEIGPDEDFYIDECTYYLGFKWVDGQLEIDEDAEFSAIVSTHGAEIAQIISSKHTTTVNSMCSPCFPGQADLDSGAGDNWDCYTLPSEYFEENL